MTSDKIILSTPLTHSDWMLRALLPSNTPFGGLSSGESPQPHWGVAGVRYMLDECKAFGLKRIYWRLFDGGMATYRTALADPMHTRDRDHYYNPTNPDDFKHAYWKQDPNFDAKPLLEALSSLDYTDFDALGEAVCYARQIGLELHAWITINEDDHAWGYESRFTEANAHSRWVKRDGSVYHSQQSFAFESVRRHKLAQIEEVLANYEVDGLFLDWMRTGDVRDNPQSDADGVADFGYEPPLVESFIAATGQDPRSLPNGDEPWVRWRAQPQTEFMRGVRALVDSKRPNIPVSVMGQNPWAFRGLGDPIDGNLRGLLLDFKTWANEGLIDSAVAAGYYRQGSEGNSEAAIQWLREEVGPDVDVWLYAWMPDDCARFDTELAIARRNSVNQILFWEADYMDVFPQKKEIGQHIRAII